MLRLLSDQFKIYKISTNIPEFRGINYFKNKEKKRKSNWYNFCLKLISRLHKKEQGTLSLQTGLDYCLDRLSPLSFEKEKYLFNRGILRQSKAKISDCKMKKKNYYNKRKDKTETAAAYLIWFCWFSLYIFLNYCFFLKEGFFCAKQ